MPGTTLLLPAALMPVDWLGEHAHAELSTLPGSRWLAQTVRRVEDVALIGERQSEPGHERWLKQCLGLASDESLSAAAALADLTTEVHWRLDPVHLRVGRDHLVLTDPRGLELDPSQAEQLATAVRDVFLDVGLELLTPTPERWYLRERGTSPPWALHTPSLSAALGRNVDRWLPMGPDARRWRKLVNEVQMTWHGHPVNQAREAEGLPAVNSVWIEGRVPRSPPGAAIHAALAFSRAGVEWSAEEAWTTPEGDTVQTIRALLDAAFTGDPQRWLKAWKVIDTTRLGERGGAVTGADRLDRIVLAGDTGWRTLHLRRRPSRLAGWLQRHTDWLAPIGEVQS